MKPKNTKPKYYTPHDYGEAVAAPLTHIRPGIADLHIGDGSLANAIANDTTSYILGIDIDPKAHIKTHPDPKLKNIRHKTINHDVCDTVTYLKDTSTKFDLLALNPPTGETWTINGKSYDSIRATILTANSLLTRRGEALIICPTDEYNKIVTKHLSDFKHAWLTCKMPSFYDEPTPKSITCIYLAKWHNNENKPPPSYSITATVPEDISYELYQITQTLRANHEGISDIMLRCHDTEKKFKACKDEIARRLHNKKSTPNISIDARGYIVTHLTSYQQHSKSLSSQQKNALTQFHNRHPYQCVLAKDIRQSITKIIQNPRWTFCKNSVREIKKAINSYSNGRISLTPLTPIQCLGWIDEQDTVKCTADLGIFKAGNEYKVSTETVQFMKQQTRPCIVNGKRTKETVEVNGHDLNITITCPIYDESSHFRHNPDTNEANNYDLNTLVNHFEMPNVQDVSQAKPALYKANLKKLETMLVAPYKLKNFQKEDIARAGCVDGLIFGHVQGLGKSLAAFAFPALKEAKRTIIVAPGGLIKQFRETAAKFYGKPLPVIKTIDDLKKWNLHKPANPKMASQYFITTYEALTRNGADEWQPEKDSDGNPIMKANDKKRIVTYTTWAKQTAIARLTGKTYDPSESFLSIGKTNNGITCIWKPSMASMLAIYQGQGAGIDCIVLDEATRLQSSTAKIACGIRKVNPPYRLVMTGTPIKNKVDSMFHLLHYAAGGHTAPTAQFPFTNDLESKARFANLHLEHDRYVTREQAKKIDNLNQGKKSGNQKVIKRSSRICNIHHLWKLVAPTILRRRKDDCGEDIVERTFRPIICKPGQAQLEVYGHHLEFPPIAPKDSPTTRLGGRASKGMQLNNLRQIALCPDDPELGRVINSSHKQVKKSWTPWTPKLSSTITLISKLLSQGEQVIVGSPFRHFNETLYKFLEEAKVPTLLLDGQTSPAQRGIQVNQFKDKTYPVLLAGVKAMGEGYSLECCSHLILPSLSWAYDENDQFIDRIWRLNSKKPVTIYPIITEASIDELMSSTYEDKKDSAQLALDARVLTEQVDDIDPDILLADAYDKYQANQDSIPEQTLEDGWPQLRKTLTTGVRLYREFHPPITNNQVTAEEITNAQQNLHTNDPAKAFAIQQARNKASLLAKIKEAKKRKK